MDILFVVDHSIDSVGGSLESMKVVMNEIKNKYKVSFFSPGELEHQDSAIRHFHYTNSKSMKSLIKHPVEFIKYYLFLRKTINKTGVKIVHSQEQIGYFAVSFFKRMHMVNPELVLIHTERGLYEKYSKIIQWLFYFSLKHTNTVVTTTNYNRQLWTSVIRNRMPGYEKRYEVIENTAGSRFEVFDSKKKCSNDDILTIGFAGRYCTWKGWGLVEEICNELANNEYVKVHIAMGCETEIDRNKTKELYDRIEKKLGRRFRGEINLSLEKMDEFYYGIDVFIITSDPGTESFGRVLVEAMSRKVVVMGTDCGGATEVIGNTKYICKNVEEFITRIDELQKDRALLKVESNNCYDRVKQYYSLRNNVDKYLSLYETYL